MKISIYHVDAFTSQLFGGNPAAVCVLENWLPEELLQNIAAENNLPATAFIVHESDDTYSTRWFGREAEIPLCGHGTMAASYVIFNYLHPDLSQIIFNYPAGTFISRKNTNGATFGFPSLNVQECELPEFLMQGLQATPHACFIHNQTYLAVLNAEQEVRNLKIDIPALQKLNCRNIIVTAQGDKVDFVSRNFYLRQPFFEDPVTGSAHCLLVPLWSTRLEKNNLHVLQVSQRGGELFCELNNDQVLLTGQAKLFLRGEIFI